MQDKILAEVALGTLESRVLYALLTQSRNVAFSASNEDNFISKNWNMYGQRFEPYKQAEVTLQDLNGLISLHGFRNHKSLEELMIGLGQSETDAKTLITNISRYQGQQDNFFSPIEGNNARGEFMMNISELRNIEGVNDALFRRLSPLVSNLPKTTVNPMMSPVQILKSQLSERVVDEINSLRKTGKLSRQKFIELTGIVEDDIISFSPGRKLRMELKVRVGAAMAHKTQICFIRPENRNPLIWLQ